MTISQDNISVSLEAARYEQWYYKRGVRTLEEFKKGKLLEDQSFELPRNAVLHHYTSNVSELGISEINPIVRDVSGISYIRHHSLLKDPIGKPKLTTEKAPNLIRNYASNHRGFKKLIDFKLANKNENNLIIENYNLFNNLYYYPNHWQSTYDKCINILNVIIDNINAVVEESDREHFLIVGLPDQVPTRVQFNNLVRSLSTVNVQPFNRFEAIVNLEIYKWISSDRETSLFAKLSDKAISKLNLLFTVKDKLSVMNLSLFDEWRKDPDDPDSKGRYSPESLMLIYLDFLNELAKQKLLGLSNDGDILNKDEISEAELDTSSGEPEIIELNEDGEYDFGSKVEEIEDPSSLDETVLGSNSSDLEVAVNDIASYLKEELEQKLRIGQVTEKQAKKYIKAANESTDILDPYGSGKTIGELLSKHDDAISMLGTTKLPHKKTVIDKSMLETKTPNITEDYVKHKLRLDILAMVYGIQRDGYLIKSYNIDEIIDVNNELEIHTVKVETIGGVTSTLKFKLPKIRKDGTFLIAGVKYFLRKARRDKPIRKVKPWKLFLTSYHSKLPVIKSQKNVDNYGKFIRDQVSKLSRDDQSSVEILESMDVFEHLLQLPNAFNIFAKGISKLKVNNIVLDFNYKSILKQYGEKEVKKHLKNDEMIIGKDNKGLLLLNGQGVLRRNNEILGTIYEYIGIPDSALIKAPVEKTLISVLGLKIPVVALVCYKFGLDNLINYLNVDYRRVQRGTRLSLTVDEYAIKFANDTLVFKRSDYLAQLLLGGLNVWKNSIALFDLEEFSTNDEIWANVMQREGIGPRYYREFESLYNIWLDPITIQTLKQLKEPTGFRPLLVRAVQLLTTDYHEKEMKGSGFLVKGYERIPGFIYSELSRSIRTQKARVNNRKLDLYPEEIFNQIQKDTSKQIREESNPIQYWKEMTNITFSGTGGQTSRVMVKEKRESDPEDIGLISEGGVDNGDVGVTTFLSYDPKVTNLLGMTSDYIPTSKEGAKIQSCSLLVSPFADRDD